MNQEAPTDTRARVKPATLPYRWIALLVLLLATVGGVFAYWQYAAIYPSTDNAYTGANIVRVAPQVSGPVIRVYVTEDDKVGSGDPLFDIDPTLYDAALRNARAQFDAAASAAGTVADPLKDAANKLDDKRKALEDAIATYRTAKDAQKEDAPPSGELIDALKSWHDALQQFNDARGEFDAEQDKQLTVTTPTVQLRAAAAQLDKANYERVKTHVTAPTSGWVSNVKLRPGWVVQAGTPAFAILEDGRWWVDANFKETDLARIKPGQKATVWLDMYPGATLDGEVESISAGSGAIFPVRIKITSPPDPDRPLRMGATATVRIDTTTEGGQ